MRIGIDGACLANRRGFGRFARLLLEALARAESPHEFLVFVDRPSIGLVSVPAPFVTVPVEVVHAPSRAAAASGRRSLGDMLAFGRAFANAKLDLLYFPASYSFVPVWGVKRVVVTMHDTLALAHPELVFPNGRGRFAWLLKEFAATLKADRIMTVSEASRRDLIEWFRLRPDRVRVVGEGPAPVFRPRREPEGDGVLSKYGIDAGRPYWLYVGGLSPHKNLSRLIEAVARLGETERLAIVGDFGDVFHTHVPELRAAVDRLGLRDRVHFTGFVPDDELAVIYSRAFALVQPSLMEGFGLPPVEAMACGTPTVSSTAGSLPEVVGNAGLFFDPISVDSIVASLRRMRDEPGLRARLASNASERAYVFSWDVAARTLLDEFARLDDRRVR